MVNNVFVFIGEKQKRNPKFHGIRKFRTLNQVQKKQILDYLDSGQSINWIKEKTKTPRSTINNIRRNREKILQQFELKKNVNLIKTIQPVTHPELEKVLFMWFLMQRKKFIPVSQVWMRQKAESFHKELCQKENCNFKASVGYVQKFRHRHGIRVLAVTGEKLSSNTNGIEEFMAQLIKIYHDNKFTLHHLYNADESGLMWKDIPSETLVLNQEKEAPGKKKIKERITITACSNLTGTCRSKLQIIGKSMKPRCFQGRVLPEEMFYESNSKAWQTRTTFKRYFHEEIVPSICKYNQENNLTQGAILVLDNASSHSLYDDFNNDFNVHVLFLPPNCTSVYQPMDQSTLQPIKAYYRSKLMENISDHDDWIGELKKVTLYDAVKWVCEAWSHLSCSVLINSWKNLLDGFPPFDELRNKIDNNIQVNELTTFEKDEIKSAYEDVTDFDIVEMALNNDIHDKENVDPNQIEEVEENIAETKMDTVVFEQEEFIQVGNAFDVLIDFYKKISNSDLLEIIQKEKNKYFC